VNPIFIVDDQYVAFDTMVLVDRHVIAFCQMKRIRSHRFHRIYRGDVIVRNIGALGNAVRYANLLSDSMGFTVEGPQIWGFAKAIPREPKICLSGNITATLNKYNNFMD
jgi:hypothetical protein